VTDAFTRYRKLLRYSAVSVIAVAVGQVALIALFYFGHWSARAATIGSCVAGGIPSYYLNRRWVWAKSGRSHMWREVTPFWVLSFVGLGLSTWLAGYAGTYGRDHLSSRAAQTALVDAASIAAFGMLWVLKFLAFERFMFGRERHRHETVV
jgi:putative flippase GtrA